MEVKLQPIVYTTDTGRSAEWYSTVLGVAPAFESESWTAIPVGDATLGIHHVAKRPADTYLELSLVSNETLEAVIGRLATVGIEPVEGIKEQPFGRSFLIRDPDGAPVQINEHAR